MLAVSSVGIQLAHHDGTLTEALDIAQRLAAAIERRTGEPAVVDDPSWEAPRPMNETLLLSVYAGSSKLRIVVERGGQTFRRDADRSELDRSLESLAAELYPEESEAAATSTTSMPIPIPPERSFTIPIIVTSIGVALAIAGGAMIAGSRAAEDELESRPFSGEESDRLVLRQQAFAWSSVAFLVAGGIGVGLGAVLFAWD
jgi:hypothetical protein